MWINASVIHFAHLDHGAVFALPLTCRRADWVREILNKLYIYIEFYLTSIAPGDLFGGHEGFIALVGHGAALRNAAGW